MSDVIRPGIKGAAWDIPRGVQLLVCRVTPGNGWWELDDEVEALPGRIAVPAKGSQRWHAFPESSLSALESFAERHPKRVVIHRAFRRAKLN